MALSFTVTTEDVAYYPADVPIPTINAGAFAANTGPYFNFYAPTVSKPANRTACLVRINGGGYSSSTRVDTAIATDNTANYGLWLCAEFLARGDVVIQASTTTGNTSNTLVAGGVTSKGLLHPPGARPASLSFEPWKSVNYPMCFKDAIYLIQYLKANAATFGFNPNLIVTFGDSMSADCALAASCRDWRGLLDSTDAQSVLQSTRVAGMILDRCHTYWPSYDSTATQPVFPDQADTGANTAAATFADAPTAYKRNMSFLGQYTTMTDFDFLASIPIFLTTGVTSGDQSDTIAVNTNLVHPYAGVTASEPSHSAYFSAILRAVQRRSAIRFECGSDSNAASVANEDGQYGTDAQTGGQKTAVLLPHWMDWIARNPLASRMPAAVRA